MALVPEQQSKFMQEQTGLTHHPHKRHLPPQPAPYHPPKPIPPPPPPNPNAATAWPLYNLYPPGPEWPYSQHVPASQEPGRGYDIAASRVSEERRIAAINLANGQLQDGPQGYNLALFVQSIGIDMQLAGSYGQSQYTRDYYPRNFVTSNVTVVGQSLTQEDYGVLCEFVHSCQHKAIAHGYNNLTQLFVIGRTTSKDPAFQGRGYDGNRQQGTRVMISQAEKLMGGSSGHTQDPKRAPAGTYYSQSVRGAHQTLAAKGYITAMPRIHRQFEYAVIWSFTFTIAALIHGPFNDPVQGLPQKAPVTWLNMLQDIQKSGVISNQTKGLQAFNKKVVKAASSAFINPLTSTSSAASAPTLPNATPGDSKPTSTPTSNAQVFKREFDQGFNEGWAAGKAINAGQASAESLAPTGWKAKSVAYMDGWQSGENAYAFSLG